MTFTAGFLFCGLGAGARGFLDATASLRGHEAGFRSLGGIDNDAQACTDFAALTGSPATCADLARMTPEELRGAWGDRAPDAIFLSPPCKGMSALLSKKNAAAEKYQALNRLVLQGLFLACETWQEPPATIVLENVPRIVSRGAVLLAQARSLLTGYGYLLHEGFHDCGELGGLAQHRRRFLLIARQQKKVPQFVYRPPLKRVKACGEVLGPLPLPEAPEAGALHRLPRLSWINWVRLALVPAGGDWRDLPRGELPENPARHETKYRVSDWNDPAHTVTGARPVTSGGPSVADPRVALAKTAAGAGSFKGRPGLFGVNDWDAPAPTVAGVMRPAAGSVPASIADPRLVRRQSDVRGGALGVLRWDHPAPTITGHLAAARSNTPGSVADPRLVNPVAPGQRRRAVFARHGVLPWSAPAGVVAGSGSNGAQAVADPRVEITCAPRAGAYGVVAWADPAGTVTGSAQVDNGPAAVADPRLPSTYRRMTIEEALAAADSAKAPPRGVIPVIASPHDGTWHRPLTTLELAALQGLPTILHGKPLALAGRRVAAWRERIGNAVPVQAGQAIGEAMLRALLASKLGTWTLGSTDIWVAPREDTTLEASP